MIFSDSLAKIKDEIQKPPVDYTSAKEQSVEIDKLLGYQCELIEDDLFINHQESIFSNTKQLWYGLDLQSMQTPYSEILQIIKHLNPQAGETWIDLGAAYGRMGIVLGLFNPMIRFIGYEMVPERVNEGNRIFGLWKFGMSQMKTVDLASIGFEMDSADLYFLYDFGSKNDVYVVLEKLKILAEKKPICIVARGRAIKGWILMDQPWLFENNPPEHFAHWSVFRS